MARGTRCQRYHIVNVMAGMTAFPCCVDLFPQLRSCVKVEVAVLGSPVPNSLDIRQNLKKQQQQHMIRAQELCESRSSCPGLLVPNDSLYGLCGRKATPNSKLYLVPGATLGWRPVVPDNKQQRGIACSTDERGQFLLVVVVCSQFCYSLFVIK